MQITGNKKGSDGHETHGNTGPTYFIHEPFECYHCRILANCDRWISFLSEKYFSSMIHSTNYWMLSVKDSKKLLLLRWRYLIVLFYVYLLLLPPKCDTREYELYDSSKYKCNSIVWIENSNTERYSNKDTNSFPHGYKPVLPKQLELKSTKHVLKISWLQEHNLCIYAEKHRHIKRPCVSVWRTSPFGFHWRTRSFSFSLTKN